MFIGGCVDWTHSRVQLYEKARAIAALWFKSAKIRDVSTEPLARPFARSLALPFFFYPWQAGTKMASWH